MLFVSTQSFKVNTERWSLLDLKFLPNKYTKSKVLKIAYPLCQALRDFIMIQSFAIYTTYINIKFLGIIIFKREMLPLQKKRRQPMRNYGSNIHSKIFFNQEPIKYQQQFENNNYKTDNCIQKYKMIVGLIQAKWIHIKTKGVISTYNATAFAISPNIIATSFYNIFSKKLNSYTNIIDFIPDLNSSSHYDITKKYRAILLDKENDKKKMNYQLGPIEQTLALLYLQQPLEFANHLLFPTLGSLSMIEFNSDEDTLHIIGYRNNSNLGYSLQKNLCVKPQRFVGTLYLLRDTKLYYKIRAYNGFQGCPIFAVNKKQQITVVGMHTNLYVDASNYINLGLHFTAQTLDMIQQIQMKFRTTHNLLKQINFICRQREDEIKSSFQGIQPQLIMNQKQKAAEQNKLVIDKENNNIRNNQMSTNFKTQGKLQKNNQNQEQDEEEYQNTSNISIESFLSLNTKRFLDQLDVQQDEQEQKQIISTKIVYLNSLQIA